MAALGFDIVDASDGARRGRLALTHGEVETPAFMPVGTYGAVRGVEPRDLRDAGAQIALANTYHLHERPGEDVIARLGGLHGFTGWDGPWLTDSGGFQVTSMADRVKIDEEGVAFASPLDGKRRTLTPENTIAIQEALGSDIAMVLDECIPIDAGDRSRAAAAMERSVRWAERASRARKRSDQAVFGIVQGGVHEELRQASAEATAALGFDGHAHGGLGLGEDAQRRIEMVALSHEHLPADKPRYLMGLGRPEDLVDAIAVGVDLFDCVIPTRHARHAMAFTREGVLNLKNAAFREDPAPLDAACSCPTCANHTRAYLRHLFVVGDQLGPRLASLHNLHFYLGLLRECRTAISNGTFPALRNAVRSVAGRRLGDAAPAASR